MPKLKVSNRFGIIPNALLNDPNISWKAKGLFWYLQSKPDDWDFAVARICKEANDGEKATISWIKELEHAGYLKRNKYQNALWHWDIEYILSDIPIAENRQQEIEAVAENPCAENPCAENRQTIKEIISKKETVNKKYIDDEFLNEKIIEFIENRKQLKKPMTPLAIEKVITKVENWITWSRYTKIQIGTFFDRSIECGWQGVFEQGFATQYRMQQKNEYEKQGARKDFVFSNQQ